MTDGPAVLTAAEWLVDRTDLTLYDALALALALAKEI